MGVYLDQQTQLQQMQDASNDMLSASQDEYVDALQDKYEDFLDRVTNDAKSLRSDIVDRFNLSSPPNYSDYVAFQGDFKLAKQIQNQLITLNQSVNSDILDSLEATYKDSYNLNSWSMDEATPPNLDVNYSMPPDLVIRQLVSSSWNGNMFSQNIGVINDMMARDIQSAVAQSMLSGDSTKQLGARISKIIGTEDNGYIYRANMIARTQLVQAANMARESVLNDNDDLIQDWIWESRSLAQLGSRLCEDCAERSGHTYDEVKEIAEDQELPFSPGFVHPFCGCTWAPQAKSWQDLLPPGVAPIGTLGPNAMSYPSDSGVQTKVVPMKYADWADRYLAENERGDI